MNNKNINIRKTEKSYFLDTSSEICHSLDYFSLEELEEVDYEIYEAIPFNDSNTYYVFCSLDREITEREFCKKSQCKDYTSKSGRGVCSHRGKLFEVGEKVNVKNLIK